MKILKKIIERLLAFFAKGVLFKYNPIIIGITGSVGKTSTKEAIACVLADSKRVRQNIKNYNNELGVPLTILGCESGGKNPLAWFKIFFQSLKLLIMRDLDYPEILILEMGADRPGDISFLTKLAPCHIGVLTAIGSIPVHIEFFKDLKQLTKEKGIILTHLKKKDCAIVNGDDPTIQSLVTKVRAKCVTVGLREGNTFRASDLSISSGDLTVKEREVAGVSFKLHIKGKVIPVFIPNVLGLPPVMASLFAFAVGSYFEIPLLTLTVRLRKFEPPKGRMRIIDGIKNTIILDDSYNASPKAVGSALEVLKQIETTGRKIACLADMTELGSFSRQAHEDVGTWVSESGVSLFIAVGKNMAHAERMAKAKSNQMEVFHFSDAERAGQFVQHELRSGDIVLVKGSQSQRMEKVVKELMADPLKAKELLVRQEPPW